MILMNAEMTLKIAIMVGNVSIPKVLLNVIVKALDTVEEDVMMMLMNVLRNLASMEAFVQIFTVLLPVIALKLALQELHA